MISLARRLATPKPSGPAVIVDSHGAKSDPYSAFPGSSYTVGSRGG